MQILVAEDCAGVHTLVCFKNLDKYIELFCSEVTQRFIFWCLVGVKEWVCVTYIEFEVIEIYLFDFVLHIVLVNNSTSRCIVLCLGNFNSADTY